MAECFMVLLTAAYVVATVILVRYTGKAVEVAERTLDRSVAFQRELSRPYLCCDIAKTTTGGVELRLKNNGSRSAYSVQFSINPTLKIERVWNASASAFMPPPGGPQEIDWITSGITVINPGILLVRLVDSWDEFKKKHTTINFKVEVCYREKDGITEHKDTFQYDMANIVTS